VIRRNQEDKRAAPFSKGIVPGGDCIVPNRGASPYGQSKTEETWPAPELLMILSRFVREWTSWPVSVPEHSSNKTAARRPGRGRINPALVERVPRMSGHSPAQYGGCKFSPTRTGTKVPPALGRALTCREVVNLDER
jgi:hypothetical protein